MPLQLMKLNVAVDAVTTTGPISEKFFNVTAADTAAGTALTIDAADFFDNTGEAVTALPELGPGNSYYGVYVNGVLQMEDMTTYTPGATTVGSLVITLPADGEPIIAGTPIVLEIVNFVPATTVTVTS